MDGLRRRVAVAAAAAGLGVALVLVGGVALGGGDPGPGGPAGASVPQSESPARGSVAALQARVAQVPGDWVSWAALGSAYVEQSRVSGDPSLYPRAEEALQESLLVQPDDNAEALAGLAALAAARHDFTEAVTLAERSLAVNAHRAATYGVLSDALIELGRYDEATTALQRMVDLSPDAAAFARISYLRELHGDLDGARQALERSLESSSSSGTAAYASYYLGELAFNSGDLDAAQARYDEAIAQDGAYLPPVAGLAKVAAARGDVQLAEAEYRRVLDALPLPEYAVELGELLASVGRGEEAGNQFELVRAQIQLVEANGGSADLEAALFAADHGDPADALTLAQREHDRRQSIHTDDALAWALHVNGRHAEALPLVESALRLGTRDASIHFHKGMIELALGLDERAEASLQEALDINPYFSFLHAPTAQAELARLRAAG